MSRSGYYKWKKRELSRRVLSREKVIGMVKNVHDEHTVHGYRWTAAYIRLNLHYSISDNYVYKCFQYLGMQSVTRHKSRSRPRKVKDKYPNLIFSTWDTVDRPRHVIVSDMTAMHISHFYIETTFYNNRPCYAIGYNTPSGFKKMYDNNNTERKNTFDTMKKKFRFSAIFFLFCGKFALL